MTHSYVANNYEIMITGSLMVDTVAADLEKISDSGEVTYTKTSFKKRVGGHPHNVIVDLAKLRCDPGKLAVIGAVGEDELGDYICNIFREYNITTDFIQKFKGKETGQNIILQATGEDRRFHIFPGANLDLEPKHVIESIQQYKLKILSARPGYTGMDKEIKNIFKALGNNTVKLLDVMRPYDLEWSDVFPALGYTDIIHGNEGEIKGLAGKKNLDDAIKNILSMGVKAVFVTRGGEGKAILQTREGVKIEQMPFDAYPYISERETLDMTGCGDAFCAGVIYTLMEWKNFSEFHKENENKLSELLLFAQAVGASAATRIGCTEGVSINLVERIISEQGEERLKSTEIQML